MDSKEELFKIEKSSELTEEKDIKESSFSKQTSESRNKTTSGFSIKLPRIKIRRKNERERLKNKNKQKMASSPQDLTNITKKGIDDQLTFTKINRENEKEKIKTEPIEKKTKENKWNGENQLKKSEELETMSSKELKKRPRYIKKKKKLKLKKDLQERKSKKKDIWDQKLQDITNNKAIKIENELGNQTESSISEMHRFIIGKKETKKENILLDEDIKKFLEVADDLLGKLPEEVVDEFVKSKDYELYEKVIKKYKIK